MTKTPCFLVVTLILASSTAGPARSAEIETTTSSSEHQIRLDEPVKSNNFPTLAGELMAPEELHDPSEPVPPGFDNVIACEVHVENQGVLKKRVRVKLRAEVLFDEGGSPEVLSDTRKTNIRGTAFFRLPIPVGGAPESAAWTAAFSRRKIDHAAGRCQLRSFAPCTENAEIGCVGNRYAVSLAGASSLGGGAFDLAGQGVNVAVNTTCKRQSIVQVKISVDDDFAPSQGATLEVRDTESGVLLRRDDLTLQARTTISLSWPTSICDPQSLGCRSPCP